MQALTAHVTTATSPVVESFFVASFEDGFGLPDGDAIEMFQAYDMVTGKPCGPRHGDTDPGYVRHYVIERNPAAIECAIVSVAS